MSASEDDIVRGAIEALTPLKEGSHTWGAMPLLVTNTERLAGELHVNLHVRPNSIPIAADADNLTC